MKRYTFDQIKRRVWGEIVFLTKDTYVYPFLYRSYWFSLLHWANGKGDIESLFMTARPNPGAGIGHQISNWISGFWWARYFGVKFAHIAFPSENWENFLGFGVNEAQFIALKNEGYASRRIPLFDENDKRQVQRIRKIVSAYSGSRTILICEQDQFYYSQCGVIDDIQNKFHSALERSKDKIDFSTSNFNIAIHVRRGDIMGVGKNLVMTERYLSDDYYLRVLNSALNFVSTDKAIHVYFFSQGNRLDFVDFENVDNMHWCLDMDTTSSFLHFVYADLLITSRSSFSYKPALLNRTGIKICPGNFWHGYPDRKDFILVGDDGTFDQNYLK